VGGDGIQRTAQAIIVELGGGDAQYRHQDGLGQPVRHLGQRPRRHEPVEHQDDDHGAMIDLAGVRAVAVDDLAHVQDFQPAVEHGQGAQVAAQLGPRQPVHHGGHGQGATEQQPRPTGRPDRALVGALGRPIAEHGPLAPAAAGRPRKRRAGRRRRYDQQGHAVTWRRSGRGCRTTHGQAALPGQGQQHDKPEAPNENLRPTSMAD
jgi:hypothetical protein